jgi:hypothetical protein
MYNSISSETSKAAAIAGSGAGGMLAIVICVGKVLMLLRVARGHSLRVLAKVGKYPTAPLAAPRR